MEDFIETEDGHYVNLRYVKQIRPMPQGMKGLYDKQGNWLGSTDVLPTFGIILPAAKDDYIVELLCCNDPDLRPVVDDIETREHRVIGWRISDCTIVPVVQATAWDDFEGVLTPKCYLVPGRTNGEFIATHSEGFVSFAEAQENFLKHKQWMWDFGTERKAREAAS